MNVHPSTFLACAFPPRRGLRGAMTTIADLPLSLGRADKVFVNSKRAGVRAVVAANMARGLATGHGNAAKRRQFGPNRYAPKRGTATAAVLAEQYARKNYMGD